MVVALRRQFNSNPGLTLFIGGVLLMDAIGIIVLVTMMFMGFVLGDWISFYTGGTLVRTGNASHLYDAAAQAAVQSGLFERPMGYPLPVFAAFIFAPFSALSFAESYLAWLILNLIVLAVILRLSWRWLDDIPCELRAVFLVCGVSITALEVLMQGQVDLFILGGFIGCYALLRADRPFSGGAVLALALFKPHIAAAVVLLLLVKRQWRALAGFSAAGAPLMIVPALIYGPGLVFDQIELLLSYANTASRYGVSADMMINIRGTVTSLTGSSNVLLWLPLLVLIAAVALAVAVRVWTSRPALHPQSWALAFMLPLLYSPHIHVQSLILLVAAGALYLNESQASDRPIRNIRFVVFPLVGITGLWTLGLSGLSLMSLFVMAAFTLFAHDWPEPAVEAIVAFPERAELALAS